MFAAQRTPLPRDILRCHLTVLQSTSAQNFFYLLIHIFTPRKRRHAKDYKTKLRGKNLLYESALPCEAGRGQSKATVPSNRRLVLPYLTAAAASTTQLMYCMFFTLHTRGSQGSVWLQVSPNIFIYFKHNYKYFKIMYIFKLTSNVYIKLHHHHIY